MIRSSSRPSTNTTGEPVFDETLSQALNVQLSQSPFLAIVPDRQIRETLRRWIRAKRRRFRVPVPATSAIARNVKAMLQPTIARIGTLYVVTLEAFECRARIDRRRGCQGRAQGGRAQGARRRHLGRPAEAGRDAAAEVRDSHRAGDHAVISRRCRPIRWAARSARKARRSNRFRSSGARWSSTRISPPRTRCCRPSTACSASCGQSEEHAREAYARRDRVSERERFLITYQYHDRVTGDQVESLRTAGSVEGDLSSRFRSRQRPGADLQSPRHVRAGHRRSRRKRWTRQPDHPFPLSNLAYAYRGLNNLAEARRWAQRAVDSRSKPPRLAASSIRSS